MTDPDTVRAVRAAFPPAADPAVRARMQGQKTRDTQPELRIRRLLWSAGLRGYRVDQPVAMADGRRRRPDIVWNRWKVAVFVDGCWWHGCEVHPPNPRTNAGAWKAKIAANRRRDHETTRGLEQAGWTVLRFWEHEDTGWAVDMIVQALDRKGMFDD